MRFEAEQTMSTYMAKKATGEQNWYLIDATDLVKMDVIGRRVMQFGFDGGDGLENR